MRILALLSLEDELNVTAISRKTGLNHTRVRIHLDQLQEHDIIQEKRFGRIRIYKINENEEGGCKIKDFLKSWLISEKQQIDFLKTINQSNNKEMNTSRNILNSSRP